MTGARWLSLAIFSAVAVTMGWLILRQLSSDEARALPSSSTLYYLLDHEHDLELLVLPGTERLKLVSRAEAGADSPMPAARWIDTCMDLTWRDGTGLRMASQRVHERSRASRFTGATEEPLVGGVVAHDRRPLTDGRVTTIPGGALLPAGGSLHLELPEGCPPLWVRGFGEAMVSGAELQRALLAASEQDRALATERSGVIAWDQLDQDERRGLLTRRWRSLDPQGQPGLDYVAHWVQQWDYELPVSALQTSALTLGPGRRLAINLQGQARILISGPEGIADLAAWAVADASADGGQPPLTPSPGKPLPLRDAVGAVILEPGIEGAFSLHLSNPTEGPIGPFRVAVDDPAPARLYGWPAHAWLSDLLGTPDPQDDTLLLAPEWRYLSAWASGGELEHPVRWRTPAPGTGGGIRLELRAVEPVPTPDGRMELTVIARGADGTELWRRAATAPSTPAPYEHLTESPWTPTAGQRELWLSEPVRLHVGYEPGVDSLEVVGDRPVVLSATVWGPLQGDERLYPLQDPDSSVRYAWQAPTRWHRLEPDNLRDLLEAGQRIRMAANVRIERPDPAAQAAMAARRYRSVEPAGSAPQASARTWLLHPGDDPDPGLLYCRVRPEDGELPAPWSAGAAGRLDHELRGVLWTPGVEALGTTWSVLLDDRPWQQGRFRQRVVRASTLREPEHATVRLVADPGVTLWLRSWGQPNARCRSARRPMRAFPVGPGSSLRFVVDKDQPEQLFVIAGLAGADRQVELLVDDGHPERSPGVYASRTQVRRQALLPVMPDTWVRPAEDPDLASLQLEGSAILLGDDLATGPHTITVTNRSDGWMWLRAAIESQDPSATPGTGLPRLTATGADR